jgi:hypothetical protein
VLVKTKVKCVDHLPIWFYFKPKVKSSSQANPSGFRVWELQLGIDPTYSCGLAKLQLPLIILLVWTRCLMHRCVCIWQYILQNYNYKPHFQNLSTYHIPHVSIGTLAAENLDVCTACDPWDSNIQLTMVKDRRPGPGMPFLDSYTCAEGGGYLFLPGFSLLYDAIHGWMMGRMDGWKKFHDHDVLYYM